MSCYVLTLSPEITANTEMDKLCRKRIDKEEKENGERENFICHNMNRNTMQHN